MVVVFLQTKCHKSSSNVSLVFAIKSENKYRIHTTTTTSFLLWQDTGTKFRENLSTGSVIEMAHTQTA